MLRVLEDSASALKIKRYRERGHPKGAYEKARGSSTWISGVLKGEPQGDVGESEELRRLAPSLLRQMWVSGESAREAGVKSSVTLQGGFNRHAVNRGFGASTE